MFPRPATDWLQSFVPYFQDECSAPWHEAVTVTVVFQGGCEV